MQEVWSWFDDSVTASTAAEAFAGWEVVPRFEGAALAGAALLRGTEIHFIVAPAWRKRLITRRSAREFLNPLLARHGMLTTRILHGSSGPDLFVRRLGFKRTWSDEMFNYYMLTQPPFERSKQ